MLVEGLVINKISHHTSCVIFNCVLFYSDIFIMKIAVNSLLSLLDVGTGFCYWLLGRDLLEAEVKRIEELFIKGIVYLFLESEITFPKS